VRKHDVEARTLDLNHLVADTLKLVETDCQWCDIRLETQLAPDLPPVITDAIQIQQVILNLVRNAIEALEAHPGIIDPRVSIATARTGLQEIAVRRTRTSPMTRP
jgi:nitrogen-specific signal transduction histidine kinase